MSPNEEKNMKTYRSGERVMVWSGAFTASLGPPQTGDIWRAATVMETQRNPTDRVYVSCLPHVLYVPAAYVKRSKTIVKES